MKRVFLSLVAVFAAGAALAQSEGVANYTISGGSGMAGTARLYFTKAAFRIEWSMSLGQGESKRDRGPREMKMTMFAKLADPDTVFSINDDTKTWSSWSSKEAQAEASKPKATYTVERLGTDKVAGYACQNARVKSSTGTEIEVCVTKELSAPAGWLAAMNRRQGADGSWWKAMRESGIDGFPVRWVTKSERRGGGGVTMEMTKFETRAIPASMFEVPAGYTKSDAASVGMSPEQKKQVDDAFQNMTPEQRRQMEEAMKNMTPEQRKQFEEMMKQHGQPPKD